MSEGLENPYAAPESGFEEHQPESDFDAVAIRTAHVSTEASIKSVGTLYILGGAIMLLSAAAALFFGLTEGGAMIETLGISAIILVFGLLFCLLGNGLRKLKPIAKNIASVFSVIGLFGFPLGTIIHGYILYLFFNAKGSYVTTDEYQKIIKLTPDIKHRTSPIILVLAILLVVLLVIGIGVAVLNG